ncbi:hypothetical protein HELRODRAFT_171836, partial [Helobdella robusta]|uniref:Uncharacterized protein n=1 Tax=Helobdella robusta TaxID=6412 RepID=T1F4R9_HELRO
SSVHSHNNDNNGDTTARTYNSPPSHQHSSSSNNNNNIKLRSRSANSVQFNKIIETVESNKADIISLKNVIKTANVNKPEVNTLKNKLNSNVVSDYSTEVTNKEGQKKNVSSSLWSDIAKSEDNCEKQNNSGETSNNPTNNKQTGKKTAMKIIGKKVSNDCKLKADKILMKKSVFCLSNVSKCPRNDVMAYLTDNGIHVVSCYPVLKQFNKMAPASTADVNNNNNSQTENKKTDEEESSTFRVCIDSSDSKKMKDPDIMPQHIIVREWQFNKKPETIVDQTKKDG